MLVIISDIHLTDESTGNCIPPNAFQLFKERLRDMAFEASKRQENGAKTYRPVEAIDLVLLGDIFDPLRTTQWTNEPPGHPFYARPWSDPGSQAFISKLKAITASIIDKNSKTLQLLQAMAAGEAISLPTNLRGYQFDRRLSELSHSRKQVPVKVNIHYMVGNHDWYYHLPGPEMDEIRWMIIGAMGLANPAGAIFPYEPSESSLVEAVFKQHDVFGRHGDFYDSSNYDPRFGRNHATLGDAMVVEVFNRIPDCIEEETNSALPLTFYEELKEIGNIRPDLMVPVWIAGLLDRYHLSKGQRQAIDCVWHDLVDQFLQLGYLHELDQSYKHDVVDDFQAVFQILKRASLDRLADWAPLIEKGHSILQSFRNGKGKHEQAAVAEEAYLSQRARFIVYGHTHHYTVYPLRSMQIGSLVLNQLYLNTGTWRPLHELCRGERKSTSFIAHKAMSYLSFYRAGERTGRSYETWSGMLDL